MSDPALHAVAAGALAGALAGFLFARSRCPGRAVSTARTPSSTDERARRIASVIPYFPFKGIERFYDIGGMLADPTAFQLCVDLFVEHYSSLQFDAIGGIDARQSIDPRSTSPLGCTG